MIRREEPEDDLGISCCWDDHGYPCGAPGVRSDTTSGGGQWYCRRHNALRLGRPDPGNPRSRIDRDLSGYGIEPEPGESVRAFAKRCMAYMAEHSKGVDRVSKEWARRILDRFADGDPLITELSLRYACESLGVDIETIRRSVTRRAAA